MTEQSRTPSLAELLRVAMSARLSDVHVALPGRVETYSASAQTADVQPLIRRPLVAADGTELQAESLPILHDVPLVFPRAAGFFLSLPVAPGDLVLLVFASRSLDQWLTGDGAEATPLDYRQHSLSDAVAFPGLYPARLPLADAHTSNLVLGLDGSSAVHVKPDGEIHLGSDPAADYVALAADTKAEITALRNTVNALVTAYNAHVHPGVISGPASTAPTPAQGTAPAVVGDVAAAKVKAD